MNTEPKEIYRGHADVTAEVVEKGRTYWILNNSIEEKNNRILAKLSFQQGPVADNGVNGIQNEPLIAILINRLEHLNTLQHCKENDVTLHHLTCALMSLEERRKRVESEVKNEV